MTDIGCRQREICEAYKDPKYQKSPILSDNFKEVCDKQDKKSLAKGGVCPL